MGILSQILGSGDVVSKGLDLIDSFHTSETEAIEAKTKAKTDLLASYAPFRIAQRYLALIFGFTFVSSYIMVLGLFFLGRDISEVQEIITEIDKTIEEINQMVYEVYDLSDEEIKIIEEA